MNDAILMICLQMTASSRACVCGHVLEEASRFIGGKRFSGRECFAGGFNDAWIGLKLASLCGSNFRVFEKSPTL